MSSSSNVNALKWQHPRAHTHTHTYTHAQLHTHTHTLSHSLTHSLSLSLSLSQANAAHRHLDALPPFDPSPHEAAIPLFKPSLKHPHKEAQHGVGIYVGEGTGNSWETEKSWGGGASARPPSAQWTSMVAGGRRERGGARREVGAIGGDSARVMPGTHGKHARVAKSLEAQWVEEAAEREQVPPFTT